MHLYLCLQGAALIPLVCGRVALCVTLLTLHVAPGGWDREGRTMQLLPHAAASSRCSFRVCVQEGGWCRCQLCTAAVASQLHTCVSTGVSGGDA